MMMTLPTVGEKTGKTAKPKGLEHHHVEILEFINNTD